MLAKLLFVREPVPDYPVRFGTAASAPKANIVRRAFNECGLFWQWFPNDFRFAHRSAHQPIGNRAQRVFHRADRPGRHASAWPPADIDTSHLFCGGRLPCSRGALLFGALRLLGSGTALRNTAVQLAGALIGSFKNNVTWQMRLNRFDSVNLLDDVVLQLSPAFFALRVILDKRRSLRPSRIMRVLRQLLNMLLKLGVLLAELSDFRPSAIMGGTTAGKLAKINSVRAARWRKAISLVLGFSRASFAAARCKNI